MARTAQNRIQAIWRIGNDEDNVELEFTYDLANTLRKLEKQCIKVSLAGREKKKYKLTADEASFKISIPLTKSHFGLEGFITADFNEKTVFFKGSLSVDSLKCPPPVPDYKVVLFNF